ncbi:RNA-directed DNA polymerase from mobile element jockey [Caerostris darwini]|uniref:RNA-directed DNA polymerase from mobile element jockey n=1 Tax=Caerostris darwini TaxID=1538125 RepID=A0AAV4MVL1_9ARAC|nr:RNA-directed DNA polymerase from mobile element jockey [Caerostris darwini]
MGANCAHSKEGRTLNHPQDFRPICILPCWGKVLDKVITERLAYHLESGKLLHDLQYGFRKQRSTINALQHIKDFILSARNKKHHTCLVSIDMANAFNSVDWSLLKGKIAILPIPDYLKRIIFSFWTIELSLWAAFPEVMILVYLRVPVWVPSLEHFCE